MSRIFLDTNFFIYMIQDEGPLSERTNYLLQAFMSRRDEIFTSVMTLGELLVKPTRAGNIQLVKEYRQILHGLGIRVLPFVEEATEVFAHIRATSNTKPPDAIQLATAAVPGCDLFLTNDQRLTELKVRGIQFITSFEKAPF